MALASVDTVMTSVIVAGELRTWVEQTGSERLRRLVETTLIAVPVWGLEPAVGQAYAGLRAHLERRGLPIGGNDYWIAAHALALEATMVTDNEREFRRVPELTVVNWLRD